MRSKISQYLLGGFFIFAGTNHFINPSFYLPLIPDYLPLHEWINWISGALEIAFGFGLFTPRAKKISALGIVALLLLFIPSHIYFIQIGSCIPDGLCVSAWIGWVRLIVIHPLLLYWAYKVAKN